MERAPPSTVPKVWCPLAWPVPAGACVQAPLLRVHPPVRERRRGETGAPVIQKLHGPVRGALLPPPLPLRLRRVTHLLVRRRFLTWILLVPRPDTGRAPVLVRRP